MCIRDRLVAEKCCQLLETKSSKSFRIFSIGCGDGTFDITILQTIADRFPDVKIHYIGTDIDGQFCQQARELLSGIKNVEIETLVTDFQQMEMSKVVIPPCDLVLAVHVFYYMTDINKALSNAQKLRKPDGTTHVLMLVSQASPHNLKRKGLVTIHTASCSCGNSKITKHNRKLGTASYITCACRY